MSFYEYVPDNSESTCINAMRKNEEGTSLAQQKGPHTHAHAKRENNSVSGDPRNAAPMRGERKRIMSTRLRGFVTT